MGSLKHSTPNINIWALFYPPKKRPFQKNLTHPIFSWTAPLSPQKQSEPLSLVFECAYILLLKRLMKKMKGILVNLTWLNIFRVFYNFGCKYFRTCFWESEPGQELRHDLEFLKWCGVSGPLSDFTTRLSGFVLNRNRSLKCCQKWGDLSYVRIK